MPDGKPQDHGPVYFHEDEMDWETLRFPGQRSKMVIHPTAEGPDKSERRIRAIRSGRASSPSPP